MTEVTVAALQLALNSADEAENIAAVSALVEEAAGRGAQIVLPPELFSGCYFCKAEDEALFALARPVAEHPSVVAMRALAKGLNVPLNRITAILAGKRAITADTALRLARFFGTSAEMWVRLQASYELEAARAGHGRAIAAEVTPQFVA